MKDIASFLEAGFVEAKYRMPLIRTFMAGEALPVPDRLHSEIGGAAAQTKKVAGICLNLLAQTAPRALMAVLADHILMANVHRATDVQHLLFG
jgi:hypothetical protein